VKLFCQTIFAKQLSFTYKVAYKVVFQKNYFTGEAELCQTGPESHSSFGSKEVWLSIPIRTRHDSFLA
jgi:hypothetical protein